MGSIPDAQVHSSATGKAAKLVEAHKNDEPLILYSGWFCPFVQRAWITLEEKEIPYQYQEINPYNKDPSFLALNPRGLVPTLAVPRSNSKAADAPHKPLIESNIICDYLEETYQGSLKLYPDDTYEKARLRIWIDFIGSRIIPAYHRFLQHTEQSPYSIEDARREFLGHLKTWISEADPEGPFFAGTDLSMADIALAPWAMRLWVFDHFKQGGLGIPSEETGGEDEQVWTRWRKWLEAVQSRASVVNTMSDQEHYLPIYKRYADDKAQSELAKAVRQGRGVP